jgi:hypothetical protein
VSQSAASYQPEHHPVESFPSHVITTPIALDGVIPREPATGLVEPFERRKRAQIPDLDHGVEPNSATSLEQHHRAQRSVPVACWPWGRENHDGQALGDLLRSAEPAATPAATA